MMLHSPGYGVGSNTFDPYGSCVRFPSGEPYLSGCRRGIGADAYIHLALPFGMSACPMRLPLCTQSVLESTFASLLDIVAGSFGPSFIQSGFRFLAHLGARNLAGLPFSSPR